MLTDIFGTASGGGAAAVAYVPTGRNAAPSVERQNDNAFTSGLKAAATIGGAFAIGALTSLIPGAPSAPQQQVYASAFNRTAGPPTGKPAANAQAIKQTLNDNKLRADLAPVQTFDTKTASFKLDEAKRTLDGIASPPRSTPTLTASFAPAASDTGATFFPSYGSANPGLTSVWAQPAGVSPRQDYTASADLAGRSRLVSGALQDDLRGTVNVAGLKALTVSIGKTFEQLAEKGVRVGFGDAVARAERNPQEVALKDTGPVMRLAL